MASDATAIDSMLPALPAIGQSLSVANTNDSQLVIGVFFLGFGISQIFFGSLSDAFGRRRVLLGGLAFFTVSMFAAALTQSFETLLILRFIQGIGAAAIRITTMAIVRDCFGGRPNRIILSMDVTHEHGHGLVRGERHTDFDRDSGVGDIGCGTVANAMRSDMR